MKKIKNMYHIKMRDYYFKKSQQSSFDGNHKHFSRYMEKFLYHMNKGILVQF